MSTLVRLATCDTALLRRSRYGDRSAARLLAGRHLDRISLLASVVAPAPEQAGELAQEAFALALRGPRPFEDALVTAFGRIASRLPAADEARGRLLVLLVEVEQRPADEVAALLGIAPSRVGQLLPVASAAAGPAHPARPCRGWGLVARRTGLTRPERHAGQAHLGLCRRCRDRLTALDRTRAQLLGGSAGVVGAVAVTQLVPLGGVAGVGVGSALAGKAAVAVVGTLGTAVLATAGAAAVAQQQHTPPPPAVRSVPTAPAAERPVTTRQSPAAPARCDGCTPRPSPSPTSVQLPLPEVTPPTTVVPTTVPGVQVPVLPLPSLPALPLPLPDELPLVDPLPSALAPLLSAP